MFALVGSSPTDDIYCTSGLVVKFPVANGEPRVRFPAGAFFLAKIFSFYAGNRRMREVTWRAKTNQRQNLSESEGIIFRVGAYFVSTRQALWSSGMFLRLGRRGHGFDSRKRPSAIHVGRVAQSVERGANNAAVQGSSPCMTSRNLF